MEIINKQKRNGMTTQKPTLWTMQSHHGSQDNVLNIAATPRAEQSGLDSGKEQGIFFFSKMSRSALGPTQPPAQWVPETLSLVIKWPGHEVNYTPQWELRLNMSAAIYFYPCYIISAQIPGARSHGLLNFVLWYLTFVGPQCGTCFMSPFWYLYFEMAPKFLQNLCGYVYLIIWLHSLMYGSKKCVVTPN
jgi:hypothetical protein